MLRRAIKWLAVALVLGAAVGYGVVNFAGHDPARWHVDPATITLRGTPNEFLAAVPGTTAALPHALASVHTERPQALLTRFDAIARAQPRVEVVAGSPQELMITYVQRSEMIGFPDYITVKALAQDTGLPEGGAGLIVYSRSRYGHGDFGVNRARVESWLAALDAGG